MLLEPGEYKIVNTIKPIVKKEETLNVDKVKFICKECESTIYVRDYDTIVAMEKTCKSCRNKGIVKLRNETIENNIKVRNEKATIGN